MDPNAPLNFTWQLAGVLATGAKPLRKEHISWLLEQGFKAIISLEPIPNECVCAIACHRLSSLDLDLDFFGSDDEFDIAKVPPPAWKLFGDFLNSHLEKNQAVYVHCSAGITRSPRMVRQYLYLRNKPTVSA